jgi:hypothetical protein
LHYRVAGTLHTFLALSLLFGAAEGFGGGKFSAVKAERGHWPQWQHGAMNRSVECAQAHTHLYGPKTSILSKICKNRANDLKKERNEGISGCQHAWKSPTRPGG